MNTKTKLYSWTIIVALAGFLFGFDTVVISGADLALQQLWGSDKVFHGVVVMASALWGTVAGAIFAAYPTDKLGRKKTLFWIGVLYTISAVGSAFASDPWMFAFFRFIGGLGVGASTIAAPTYIAEIAPAKDRGKLVATYQFNIVFGILIAYISNYLLSGIQHDAWRWMMGVEAIPAFIYTLLVLLVPESPRWLLTKKNDRKEAERVLALINPDGNAIAEADNILRESSMTSTKKESIFQPKYSKALWLAFFIAFFNQFSGINAFLYYAPRIFNLAGLEDNAALLSSAGIGLTNLIFTMVGLAWIDKYGRKQLMYIGSVGYIISLAAVSVAFFMNLSGWVVTVALFVFIASHAIGQGSVIWVFISEIFPNHLRADGQSFGCSVHWILAAAIPSSIPYLFDSIGAGTVFAIFTIMMVLQLIWTWKIMPETKGKSLEDLSASLTK